MNLIGERGAPYRCSSGRWPPWAVGCGASDPAVASMVSRLTGPSVCGDGIADAGEGCDDGNTTPSDGCSASCAVERGRHCTNGSNLVANGNIASGGADWDVHSGQLGNNAPGATNAESVYGGTSTSNPVAEIDDQADLDQALSGLVVGKRYYLTFDAARNPTAGDPIAATVSLTHTDLGAPTASRGGAFAFVQEACTLPPRRASRLAPRPWGPPSSVSWTAAPSWPVRAPAASWGWPKVPTHSRSAPRTPWGTWMRRLPPMGGPWI